MIQGAPYNPNQPEGIYILNDTLTLQSNDALTYYYYCVITVALNVDVNGNNIIELNEGTVKSVGSLPPVMAVVVDKVKPKVACTNTSTDWRPFVKLNDIDPRPNYDGTVNVPVQWAHPPTIADNDVVGYLGYRSFDNVIEEIDPTNKNPNLDNDAEKIAEAYLLLNRDLASPGLFVDKSEAQARNTFYYKLKAVDKAGNISDFSCASDPVTLPPQISAPFIREIIGGNEAVTLRWNTNPVREQVQAYRVWRLKPNLTINSRDDARRLAQDPNNRELVGTPVMYDPAKAQAQPKQDYESKVPAQAGPTIYYLVEAFRKVVLANGTQFDFSAFSEPVAARAYDITPPPVPAKVTVKPLGSAVFVSWVLPDAKDVEQMGIWRREGNGPYVMIAPLFDQQKLFNGKCTKSNCSFLDQSVQSGKKYVYKIQVFDRFGNQAFSLESDGISAP